MERQLERIEMLFGMRLVEVKRMNFNECKKMAKLANFHELYKQTSRIVSLYGAHVMSA